MTIVHRPDDLLSRFPSHTDSVLSKVWVILEAFRFEDESCSLAEIVRRTELPKATVHRLCQELVAWGVLERNEHCYWLGLRLFELGQRAPRQRTLRHAALPYIEDLVRATNETVHLAVLDGHEVVYVEKVGGHRLVDWPSRVAGRMPLHCTATGRVLLAFSSPQLIDDVLSKPLKRMTRQTVLSRPLLRRELERVRNTRVAVEHEQTRLGYLSVAVPVFGVDGGVLAAMSVTAPIPRVSVPRLISATTSAASAVTNRVRELQASRPDVRV
ncbi:MAG: IclR family transcriptional regulator [bacterium]